MARCNIFRPLTSSTGEFLMFGQYSDDITKENAEKNTYRVVPSHFVVMDMDPSGIKTMFDTKYPNFYSVTTQDEVNNILPQIFQSYYENACAVWKEQCPLGSWNPTVATKLLWSTLREHGLITKVSDSTVFPADYIPEVKYIGDININSARQVDDINYNELYCYIPTNEDEYYYPVANLSYNTSYGTQDIGMIEGWTAASYPSNSSLLYKALGITDPLVPGYGYPLSTTDYMPELLMTTKDLNNKEPLAAGARHTNPTNVSYQFNTVLLFYDIYNNSDASNPTILYKDCPMGVYFTGPYNTTTQDLDNVVTKYVTNQDAFGQGSSYGLRLCTRYVSTPNSASYTIDTAGSEDYASISLVMGKLNDCISEMRTSMTTTNAFMQNIKDHLAMFKNYTVNVPYTRLVGGDYYWFVNGHNTGRKVTINASAGINAALANLLNGSISGNGQNNGQ